MTEEKKQVTMADLIAAQSIEQIRQEASADDDSIFRDMHADYPAVRIHLLGGQAGEMRVAPGTVTFRREPRLIRLKLHKPDLGYECNFFGSSFYGLLEIAEEDLVQGTAPWTPDWKTQQRERKRMLD